MAILYNPAPHFCLPFLPTASLHLQYMRIYGVWGRCLVNLIPHSPSSPFIPLLWAARRQLRLLFCSLISKLFRALSNKPKGRKYKLLLCYFCPNRFIPRFSEIGINVGMWALHRPVTLILSGKKALGVKMEDASIILFPNLYPLTW